MTTPANSNPAAAGSDSDGKEGFGAKRQEFRNYLEKTGTLDALTHALVALYENQGKPPEDPVAFLLENLSIGGSMKSELEAFKKDLEVLHKKLADAEAENVDLRTALAEKDKFSTGSDGSERIVASGTPVGPEPNSGTPSGTDTFEA